MGYISKNANGTITGTAIATADVLITNATGRDTFFGGVLFYNTHSSAVNVYVALVDNSGSAVATPAAADVIWNATLNAVTDVGNNWDIFDFSFPMRGTNDTLVAYAGTTAVVNWVASYGDSADQT